MYGRNHLVASLCTFLSLIQTICTYTYRASMIVFIAPDNHASLVYTYRHIYRRLMYQIDALSLQLLFNEVWSDSFFCFLRASRLHSQHFCLMCVAYTYIFMIFDAKTSSHSIYRWNFIDEAAWYSLLTNCQLDDDDSIGFARALRQYDSMCLSCMTKYLLMAYTHERCACRCDFFCVCFDLHLAYFFFVLFFV